MASAGILNSDGEENKDGRYKNLSYKKMMAQVELDHPRIQVDGKSEKFPLMTNTGTFWLSQDPDEKKDIDQMGIGTVMYFKLLKFIIGFFIFAVILESYLMYQYSDGQTDGGLIAISLGNLAFNYEQCQFNDIKLSKSIFLSCRSGSLIEELNEFAL